MAKETCNFYLTVSVGISVLRRIQYLSFFSVLLMLLSGKALGQDMQSAEDSKLLFGLDKVSDIHLRVSADEWAKLQPPIGLAMDIEAAFGGLIKDAVMGKHFRSEKSTRPGLAGYLGVDHQYGKADVHIAEETVQDVGLRYKGNGTFLEYVEGDFTKRLSFKIDFNEYEEDFSFRGLGKINLNNNTSDPSLLRESLSYALFREAGIPCSRVGYAMVSLTVPGLFDRQPHGLYTLVEQVDKRFLKDRYGSSKGLLMKPSTFGSFRYLGEDWAEYEIGFVPKTSATEAQKKHVIEFAKLIHKDGDQAFEERLETYLDVDQFLRFLAVNALLSNLDSFLGGTQNHYIYLEPDSNKFQFLPWDMDHSFGAFPLQGTPDSRRDLSIDHPAGMEHTLIERVLSIQHHKETYHAHLDTYLETIFGEEKMLGQIQSAAAFVRPLVGINGPKALDLFDAVLAEEPVWYEPHPLKYFVTERRESVRRQLDGISAGSVLEEGSQDWRAIIPWLLGGLVVFLLNLSAWLWGVVAGFRVSMLWGGLNLFFYPLAPVIYGFVIQKTLGRRSALWAIFCFTCLVGFIIMIIAQESS
ncbi:MAG: hypothetical protein EVA71_09065 [Limisphaerales bacterium]|nr:MAG: hypothetical protein EVA71_09065 [Limisphaerales bacterium]